MSNEITLVSVPVPERERPAISLVGGYLPYLALLFGLATLGASALLTKWANAPGMVSGFYRMAIAAAVTAIPFGYQVRREGKLPARNVWLAVLAGLFFAGDLASWNTAVVIGNITNPTLLGNTSALWVGLGAMLIFKERLRPAFWGGLLIALFGIVLVLGDDFLTHPMLGAGDVLGLMAGFFYGAFFLVTQRARDRLSSLTSFWISVATSGAVLLALSIAFQLPLTGYPAQTYVSLLVLALVTQVAGWLAINYALGHLRASVVAPTLLGQPVITAVLAVWLLSERMSVLQVIGGVIVLFGILVVHNSKTRS